MTKEKCLLTCMSNASIKCKSLTKKKRKKEIEGTHTSCHTQHAEKNHSNINNKE